MMDEGKIAYLGFIQGTINRMAGNVFLVKGWSVALVAAMTALTSDSKFGCNIAIVPILLFWWLDAYYLRQERLYRKLYEVASAASHPVTFSMDTSGVRNGVASTVGTMLAGAVCPFYLLILGLLVIFTIRGSFIETAEHKNDAVQASVSRETYIVLLPDNSTPGVSNNPKFQFQLPVDQMLVAGRK